jgi:predicted aspartyl protease
LAKILGSIDGLGRPVIRIHVAGQDDILAIVDTGFNGSLMLASLEARQKGFIIDELTEIVELGTTARVEVRRASGTINWLGRSTLVDALISDEPQHQRSAGVARALLGTGLLGSCLLLIDFPNKLVEIETAHS